MIEQERAVAQSWAALTDAQREAMRCSRAYRPLVDALDGQPRRLNGGAVVAAAWRECSVVMQAALWATHGNLAQDLNKLTAVAS